MHCINCGKENDENSQFCMYCGAELFKAGKKGVAEGVVVQQQKATGAVSRPGKLNKIDQQKLLIGIVAVVLVLVVAVCFWAGAATTIIRLFWPAEQLVYTVQEDRREITTAIMTIRADGKDNREIYSDNDGLLIGTSFVEGSYFSAYPMAAFLLRIESTFSPDGKTIAVTESTGDLLLINKEGSSQVSVDMGQTWFPIMRGFSPDGKYFGFTDIDAGKPTLRIVDLSGKEVFGADNRYFGDFLPDSQKLVVGEVESDQGVIIGLGILDITSGEYTYLTNIDGEENAADFMLPLVSPDGRTIFYVDGNNVMSIPSKGGTSVSLYEPDEQAAIPLIAIGTRTLAVYDTEENSLYLVDIRKGTKTRVAKDLVNVVVSPNEKYMAYVTDEGNDEVDLYLAKADGSDRIRLSKNTNWFSFSFSPNKKHLAYIEGNSSSDGGSLYIVRLDGSESQRLDTGVWSFRFVEGGDYVVYVKVDDMDRGDPESEIYRIRTDGQKKSLILQADDGLFSFIWPVH